MPTVRRHRFTTRALLSLLGSALFVFTVFPFFWIILTSFRTKGDIFSVPPSFIPAQVSLENYAYALQRARIPLFAANSLIVSVAVIAITIMIAFWSSYAITAYRFRGRNVIYSSLILTQFFPVVVLLVPLYMLVRSLGLYNTLGSLILIYVVIQTPVAMFLLIGFLREFPKDLLDAASIDGCGRTRVMHLIVLPLTLPGIAATAIFIFVNVWQEYLIASSLIGASSRFTLTVGLSLFRDQHATDWGALMATAVMISLPSLAAFSSVQRFFIDSLAGSVKG